MLVISYIFFTITAMVLMKLSSNYSEIVIYKEIGLNKYLIAGMIAYCISFCHYILVIKKYDLSYIIPIATGLVVIISAIMGYLIFKENLSYNGLLGIFFISLGIILVSLK